jgi:aspartyl-tRNA(Asn)/glutamyl-tRNA(Gln) amidotransferase subunit A
VRTLIRRDFIEALNGTDALLLPVTPTPRSRSGEDGRSARDVPERHLLDPASLAGVPALSFPAGFTKAGLPIGLQLVGKPFDEGTLLRVARAWESASDAARRVPPIAMEAAA